jgi:hypothetical protein
LIVPREDLLQRVRDATPSGAFASKIHSARLHISQAEVDARESRDDDAER